MTVWRLLRAPGPCWSRSQTRNAWETGRSLPDPCASHSHPKPSRLAGMLRDEVWSRYGLPRSIWARPEQGELIWDYAQFGLTIVFNQDDVLTRWRLKRPASTIQ